MRVKTPIRHQPLVPFRLLLSNQIGFDNQHRLSVNFVIMRLLGEICPDIVNDLLCILPALIWSASGLPALPSGTIPSGTKTIRTPQLEPIEPLELFFIARLIL